MRTVNNRAAEFYLSPAEVPRRVSNLYASIVHRHDCVEMINSDWRGLRREGGILDAYLTVHAGRFHRAAGSNVQQDLAPGLQIGTNHLCQA